MSTQYTIVRVATEREEVSSTISLEITGSYIDCRRFLFRQMQVNGGPEEQGVEVIMSGSGGPFQIGQLSSRSYRASEVFFIAPAYPADKAVNGGLPPF